MRTGIWFCVLKYQLFCVPAQMTTLNNHSNSVSMLCVFLEVSSDNCLSEFIPWQHALHWDGFFQLSSFLEHTEQTTPVEQRVITQSRAYVASMKWRLFKRRRRWDWMTQFTVSCRQTCQITRAIISGLQNVWPRKAPKEKKLHFYIPQLCKQHYETSLLKATRPCETERAQELRHLDLRARCDINTVGSWFW